jgi:hypothetical protein
MLLTRSVACGTSVRARGLPDASWAGLQSGTRVSAAVSAPRLRRSLVSRPRKHACHCRRHTNDISAALTQPCCRGLPAEAAHYCKHVILWLCCAADVLCVWTAEPSSGSMPQVSARASLSAVSSQCCVRSQTVLCICRLDLLHFGVTAYCAGSRDNLA